jgi:hypothetical protein
MDSAFTVGAAVAWRIAGILQHGDRGTAVLTDDRDRTGMDGSLSGADLKRFLIRQGLVISSIHHTSPEQEGQTKHSSAPALRQVCPDRAPASFGSQILVFHFPGVIERMKRGVANMIAPGM